MSSEGKAISAIGGVVATGGFILFLSGEKEVNGETVVSGDFYALGIVGMVVGAMLMGIGIAFQKKS